MSLLKIATILLILVANTILCSLSVEPLPVIEDPVLITVWGESIELQNINYFCDSLQVARDYSPGANVEDLKKGAGFRIEEELAGESFHPFYVSGTPYRALVIIAGGSARNSEADIRRIEELASSMKLSNGLVMVIDIDVEGSGDDLVKKGFAQRLVQYLDVLIVAERPVGEYQSFLKGETPLVVELPVVVDLVSIFERDFGGGRCCD